MMLITKSASLIPLNQKHMHNHCLGGNLIQLSIVYNWQYIILYILSKIMFSPQSLVYVLTSTHCVLLYIIIGSKVILAGGSKVPDIVIFCSGVSLIAKTVVYEKTTVCFITLSYCLYVLASNISKKSRVVKIWETVMYTSCKMQLSPHQISFFYLLNSPCTLQSCFYH